MVFDFVAEEQTILSNTGMSFCLSIGIAVASVLAFSHNLVIGFYVLLTIVLAAWLPWKLNPCDNLNCFPRPGFCHDLISSKSSVAQGSLSTLWLSFRSDGLRVWGYWSRWRSHLCGHECGLLPAHGSRSGSQTGPQFWIQQTCDIMLLKQRGLVRKMPKYMWISLPTLTLVTLASRFWNDDAMCCCPSRIFKSVV